jgi:DNA processing protein
MLDLPTASALAFLPLPLQTHVFRALRERADRPARDAVVSASGDVPTLLADALRDRAHADAMWSAAQRDAELALKQGAAAGLQALPFGAALYPALLARIADPPPLLWLRGQASALAAPCIAVVGARAASPYGLQVAERIGAGLAAAGVTVVSGLARGVDSAAHRAASTIGRTVALLGSGADVIYPREHTALAADIVSRDGAIVSELAPGAPPRAGHFPRRNRLISGTSLAVVVIEASVRSGSLQTARFGLEQGREVMAVPGTVLGERFRGSHALLRDGAALVESAEDVLQELRWPAGPAATATDTMPADGLVGPREDRHPVLRTMVPGEAYDETQVVANTGLPAEEARRQLVLLEIDGQVLRTPGSRYVRHRRSRVERADG